jgi:hypothetical protein
MIYAIVRLQNLRTIPIKKDIRCFQAVAFSLSTKRRWEQSSAGTAGARRQSCKVHQGTPTSVGAPDDETVWALARLNRPLIPQAKRPMKIIVPT